MTNLVTVTQRIDTIVKALRRKPLKRFNTAELSDATGIERTVLTSNMRVWMSKNLGDLQHVHVESYQGHARYWYDPDNIRTEAPPSMRKSYKVANTNGQGEVEVQHRRRRKSETFLKLAAEEEGFVLAYTDDGRVLQGRWIS